MPEAAWETGPNPGGTETDDGDRGGEPQPGDGSDGSSGESPPPGTYGTTTGAPDDGSSSGWGDTGSPDAGTGDGGPLPDAGDGPCDAKTWYRDQDADSFGTPDDTLEDCVAPVGYVAQAGDCDDAAANVNPDAEESCDAIDNNCNALVDEYSNSNASCNGCNLAVRTGHYYYFCGIPVTWSGGQATCEALGADLVTIGDALENNFLAAEPKPVYDLWIGANDMSSEGSFQWVDGSAAAFTSWLAGEPNDANGNEDCVVMGGTLWNDVPCTVNTFGFICEGVPL